MKTAEEKAKKRFPNVSFSKDVESEDTYRMNEIRLLQRLAFIDGYKEGYNDAKREDTKSKHSGSEEMNSDNRITKEEVEFMENCNLYRQYCGKHELNGAKILTENDEGANMDSEDILKLSDILYRYVTFGSVDE